MLKYKDKIIKMLKTNLKQFAAKVLQSILTVAICCSIGSLNFTAMNTAAAQDVDGPSSAVDYTPSSTRSFKVTDYLKVKDQKQSYFEGESVPVAAFIIQVINFITLIIGSLSLLAMIAGGFLLLTSHGSENQLTKGKEIIKFAIIGLVVTFSAYFIVSFVQNLLYEV